MPRKRVVSREIDYTIATCLYLHPGKKEQKKRKIEIVGVLSPHQMDNRRIVPEDMKGFLYVKCLKVELARARFEMPIADFFRIAAKKEINENGKEIKDHKDGNSL